MAESPAQKGPEQGATPSSQARPDPAFERWRRKAAWTAGYGLSAEDEARRAEMQRLERLDNEWSKCQKWKNDLMRNSPSVSSPSVRRVCILLMCLLACRSRRGIYDQTAGIRFERGYTRSYPMHTVPPEAGWRFQPASRNPSLPGRLYQ